MTALALQNLDGMAEMAFCGNMLVVEPSGCVIWPEQKLLVVSDLHLEKGSSFAARKGVFMPPYDTQATLEMLATRILHWQPETVISLGDSFHDEDASLRLPNSYRQNLTQLMQGREWVWICGNHDPSPPENLGGTFAQEVHIGNLHFKHEPELEFRAGEIAGHLHPCAKIRQRGKNVRRRCVAGDGNRLILPAFGAFTGGLNVKDKAYQDLFDWERLTTWMLGRDNVYRISGKQLVY